MRQDDWKKLIEKWKSFEPPMVISKEEVRIYKNFIRDKKGEGLIFGATPQLRDLFYELGVNVTLVDWNEKSINLMSELMENKPNEDKVVSDWFEFKSNKKFDIIVGDHIFNNVDFEKYDELLQIIKNLARKDSIIIINQVVSFDENIGNLKFSRNVKDHTNYYYKVCTNDYRIFDKKTNSFHAKKFNELNKNFFFPYWDVDFNISMPRINLWEEKVKKYFDIIDVKNDESHPVFEHHKIYLLKINKNKSIIKCK